jgi:hypothetical protein
MRDKLQALLAQLRHGMAEVLDTEIERAEREATPGCELLHRMLGADAAARRQRSLAYRLDHADLPWDWTLDTFPFERQPGIDKAQIKGLADLDFLRRADNLLLIGPSTSIEPSRQPISSLTMTSAKNASLDRTQGLSQTVTRRGFRLVRPKEVSQFGPREAMAGMHGKVDCHGAGFAGRKLALAPIRSDIDSPPKILTHIRGLVMGPPPVRRSTTRRQHPPRRPPRRRPPRRNGTRHSRSPSTLCG